MPRYLVSRQRPLSSLTCIKLFLIDRTLRWDNFILLHECFWLFITMFEWTACEMFTDIIFWGLRFTRLILCNRGDILMGIWAIIHTLKGFPFGGCCFYRHLGQKVSFSIKEHAFAGTWSLAEIDPFRLLLNTYARILKAHSHSHSNSMSGSSNLSFSRVSLAVFDCWRASVIPYYLPTHPPAIQKQHWHSREAQIEPPLIECECEWAFRIRA
jgi:hypothetical protein